MLQVCKHVLLNLIPCGASCVPAECIYIPCGARHRILTPICQAPSERLNVAAFLLMFELFDILLRVASCTSMLLTALSLCLEAASNLPQCAQASTSSVPMKALCITRTARMEVSCMRTQNMITAHAVIVTVPMAGLARTAHVRSSHFAVDLFALLGDCIRTTHPCMQSTYPLDLALPANVSMSRTSLFTPPC
jgi:hypothetical protein